MLRVDQTAAQAEMISIAIGSLVTDGEPEDAVKGIGGTLRTLAADISDLLSET